MYSYSAYGLGIGSALPLPELLEQGERRPDVMIRLDAVSDAPPPLPSGGMTGWARRDESCLVVPGVGAMLIRHGREIVLDAVPEADAAACRLFLLGPAMGLLLHQRGFLVLHASAMVFG